MRREQRWVAPERHLFVLVLLLGLQKVPCTSSAFLDAFITPSRLQPPGVSGAPLGGGHPLLRCGSWTSSRSAVLKASTTRQDGTMRDVAGVGEGDTSPLKRVEALVSEGRAAEALMALEGLQELENDDDEVVDLYHTVLRCCAAQGSWELALQAIKNMVISAKHAPSSETYRAGIAGCIKAGNQVGGLKIYEAMVSAGIPPTAEILKEVLNGLPEGAAGMPLIEEARQRFGLEPTNEVYRTVIHKIAAQQQPSTVPRGTELPPSAGGGRGGAAGGRTPPAVKGAPALAGMVWLPVVELSKYKPLPEAALVALIEEAARTRRLPGGIKGLEQVVDLVMRDADPATITEATFLQAISLCKHFNSLDQGLRLLRASQGMHKATVLSFNMVMKMAERSKDPRRALALLKEMKKTEEAGCRPDTVSYNTAISACAKACMPDEALRLLVEMEEVGLEPNLLSFNSAIDALAHGGRWKEAVEMMNTIYRRGLQPDVITFTGLIQACSRGGQAVKALTYLDSMKMAGIVPDAVAYCSAIEACARGGMHDKAAHIFQELKAAGLRPSAQVYRALIQAGGMSVDEIGEMLPLLAKHDKNNYVYSAAIRACERESKWEMALSYFQDMTGSGVEPDDLTITQLLKVLAHAARADEALQVFATTKRRNVRHFTATIQACAAAGQASQALELYEEMRSRRVAPDTVTFNGLFTACRSNPEALAPKALVLYRTMRDQYKKLKPDIVTLTLLIGTLEKAGSARWQQESVRIFSDGVEQGVLFKSYLDSLYEKDLSKLSFQLIRPAVVYTLEQLRRHYSAREEGDDDEAEDLIFITGVDRTADNHSKASSAENSSRGTSSGSSSRAPPPPRAGASSSYKTRAQLAQEVLAASGLLLVEPPEAPSSSSSSATGQQQPTVAVTPPPPQGDAGIVRVPKQELVRWLVEEQAAQAEAQRRRG